MRFSHFFFFVSLLFALAQSSVAHFAPAAAHLPASAASPTFCGTRQAAPSPVPTTPSILLPIDSDSATPATRPAKFLQSRRRPFAMLLLAAFALVAGHLLSTPLSVEAAERVETIKVVDAAKRVETIKVVDAAKRVETIKVVDAAERVETVETVEAAQRAVPVAAAVTAEPGIVISDAVPDTEVHFVPATIKVGKAHAAACKTEACAKDLLKKVEAAHCAIGTRDFDDVMYLAIVADLGLDIAAEEERNLARNAAQDIVAYCNSSVNRAELIADDAATIADRIYMLSNCSWDDLENLALYEHAAILALHSARWRATAWEALTEEHAKRMTPGTAWLKSTTSSDRHIRFADD
ncbi:hypothetical protein GGI03_001985 [Coemansia sp. RSA 2337]|nr:hypothetical protein H4S03_002964 [Coemansia sp. S3946]KAJ2075027.1 hypothetical protein GGH13_000913 [Coemansia sp. S155-1]KAJ2466654.1 hypothetical protein GGI03_001985 [Coemansia sp. RSA 2337]